MPQTIRCMAPEEQGIPSPAIERFLRRLEEKGIPLHSFLLMRGGALVHETYYAPYTRETPHRMFSVTKSMVSLAIGLLCEEGALALDDRIVDYFPDKQPARGPYPQMRQLTIRQMLTMQTPHSANAYKALPGYDWTKSFFALKPDHEAGTGFFYDTASSHTLAALVERVSGEELMEYLERRLFGPLGASGTAYCLKDPSGVSMGGSGLVCPPRDLLCVMQLLLDGGTHDGKQLLPKEYLRQAVRCQVSTLASGSEDQPELCQGYGYQFWRTTHNGFACYGMGGQLGVCLPDKDLVFVTTADTQGIGGGVQAIYDAFWETIYSELRDEAIVCDPAVQQRLKAYSQQRKLYCVLPGRRLPKDPYAPHHWKLGENPGGFLELWLTLQKTRGSLRYRDKNGVGEIAFGVGENIPGVFPEGGLPCVSSGAWVDEKTFFLKCQMMGENIGSVRFQISCKEDRATLRMWKREEILLERFQGVIDASEQIN